ncbi:MAG TPA: stage II sporulation protein M [Pyrinomonadaceae bacterium]
MSSDRFIDERKNAWQRLEDLLRMLDRSSLRRLHREEVRELGRIYRRTASDLAIARAESRDPRLVNYLNSLVIRAHGRIYRADAAEGGRRIRKFFAREFPRTFRRTWRFTALAFGVFMLFFAFAFVATQLDAGFSEFGGVSPVGREDILRNRPRWWEDLNDANQIGASFIMVNNILVMFRAFAYGALFGFGTLYEMARFGVHVGSILSLTYLAGYGNDLLTFMSAHGVIELSCIFIAGGAGMLFGSAVLMPGDLSRSDALRLRGRDAIRLVIGCVPLLVVAGVIEGFISPALISPAVKFAVAGATFVALYTYLVFAGRETEAEEGGKG